jgi:hypothetical protein
VVCFSSKFGRALGEGSWASSTAEIYFSAFVINGFVSEDFFTADWTLDSVKLGAGIYIDGNGCD